MRSVLSVTKAAHQVTYLPRVFGSNGRQSTPPGSACNGTPRRLSTDSRRGQCGIGARSTRGRKSAAAGSSSSPIKSRGTKKRNERKVPQVDRQTAPARNEAACLFAHSLVDPFNVFKRGSLSVSFGRPLLSILPSVRSFSQVRGQLAVNARLKRLKHLKRAAVAKLETLSIKLNQTCTQSLAILSVITFQTGQERVALAINSR